ncbi:Glutathione S-transferase, protein [Cordyceps fumosorosea ARSEF 2679]|uniref:Glutathione S-transferase, protein n=1 Tax=Cordyceps fumosorosea (strain ARSEF 2679) TaxID=1081104 RepID=A0A162LLZ0_CORFA|nr:Glutathione S-transferase, protein [Cordyceps fumosorosea ARSEF 2679]OAA72584.1 Glutathione S-transferase, protein [Cordyceps fumosorosea ARSEF 2679]
MSVSKPVHFFDVDSTLSGPLRSWSSNTLKIRMVLNYKQIPYLQSFISYPDIAPLLQSFSVKPHATGRVQYTLPAIRHPESITANPAGVKMDSLPIACHLDKLVPQPALFPSGEASYALALATEKLMLRAAKEALFVLLPKSDQVLDDRSKEYFFRTRAEWFGKPLPELAVKGEEETRRAIDAMKAELEIFIKMLAGTEGKKGPFLEGDAPGYADFILVTFLSWSHRVDMDIWRETMAMGDGEFQALWDACLPWMEGQGEDVDPHQV